MALEGRMSWDGAGGERVHDRECVFQKRHDPIFSSGCRLSMITGKTDVLDETVGGYCYGIWHEGRLFRIVTITPSRLRAPRAGNSIPLEWISIAANAHLIWP